MAARELKYLIYNLIILNVTIKNVINSLIIAARFNNIDGMLKAPMYQL